MANEAETNENNTTYIGDGVYASFDGWYIWLKTEGFNGTVHAIALEPEVLRNLNEYADQQKEKAK